jgi:hypothetical protein
MKTIQMTSNSSGRPVANQFELFDSLGNRFFQSYKSMIAKISNTGKVFLDKNYWDYSTTTGKYRNQFLNEKIAETRKKIESGQYILIDLNSEMDAYQEQELKAKFFDTWKAEEQDQKQEFRNKRYAERLLETI